MKQIFFTDYILMEAKPDFSKLSKLVCSKEISLKGVIITGFGEYQNSSGISNVPDYEYNQRFELKLPYKFRDNSIVDKNKSEGLFLYGSQNILSGNLAKNPQMFAVDVDMKVGDEINLTERMILTAGYDTTAEFYFTYNYLFLYE